ncbi:MAG: OsmC family protein [Bacteroidales bacterium]
MAIVNIKWTDGMSFEGVLEGHKIRLDAASESGGADSGFRPKALMLVAFAGCTGMDIVSLIKKMREEIEEYDMTVDADLAQDHPKVYTRFNIVYNLKGSNLSAEKVIKSVKMSQETYCGVAAMLRMIAPLTYQVILNGEEILSA